MDIGALRQCLISVSFILGTAGNIAALWILYKSAKSNSKHVLMLKCLAVNDLVAQLGMLVLLNLPKYTLMPVYWKCALYVMLRAFGLGSGCVALVMAVERWLALTRPFIYQQYVTKNIIKRVIFLLWGMAALLTYFPLFGFGLFYNNGQCYRYREAVLPVDVTYAYLFLVFGSSLCVCIAYCNMQVFCALSHVGVKKEKVLVRRVSRSIITQQRVNHKNFSTPEELAFAKLMAIICIVFIVCWMPQMISIPLAQFVPTSSFYKGFSRIADVLMCVYFTLDPYIYVLHQYIEKRRFKMHFKRQNSNPLPSIGSNLNSSEALRTPLAILSMQLEPLRV